MMIDFEDDSEFAKLVFEYPDCFKGRLIVNKNNNIFRLIQIDENVINTLTDFGLCS